MNCKIVYTKKIEYSNPENGGTTRRQIRLVKDIETDYLYEVYNDSDEVETGIETKGIAPVPGPSIKAGEEDIIKYGDDTVVTINLSEYEVLRLPYIGLQDDHYDYSRRVPEEVFHVLLRKQAIEKESQNSTEEDFDR